MYLAADIGGTKTRLAIFEAKGTLECVCEKSYPSKNYNKLSLIVEEFIKEHPFKGNTACFGIAGPVRENKVQTTNLPWTVDAVELKKTLNLSKVFLINDLEANAWGLRLLKDDEFEVIHEGQQYPGNAALISAGTGLGEAGLYWNGNEHFPFACEGGHADFSPRDELEIELLSFLKKKYGHVSWERVVSGPGIYELYEFLIKTNKEKRSPFLDLKNDPAKVISEKALEQSDLACVKALHWFVSFYGAEAGNLALKFLSLGGIYIGGGIAPKILDVLKSSKLEGFLSFKDSFIEKGRMKKILEKIPIKVVLNPKCALIGAAEFANIHDRL